MSKSDSSKGIQEPQQQVGGNAELPAPCFLQTEYTCFQVLLLEVFEHLKCLQATPQAGGNPQSQLAGWEKMSPSASID